MVRAWLSALLWSSFVNDAATHQLAQPVFFMIHMLYCSVHSLVKLHDCVQVQDSVRALVTSSLPDLLAACFSVTPQLNYG
jgi:exosome complex RNA-binding protein Csl4